MSIPALLAGCTDVLRSTMDRGKEFVGCRVYDGAPHGAYKRGTGWYFGFYFAGFQGTNHQALNLTYSVGLDVTRVMPEVHSAERGTWMLKDRELWDMVGRVTQLFMAAQGKVAVACNAALAGTWEEGRGCFREQFQSVNCGKGRAESPDWILGLAKESQVDNPIVVVPITFTGLKWYKLLDQLWTGGDS